MTPHTCLYQMAEACQRATWQQHRELTAYPPQDQRHGPPPSKCRTHLLSCSQSQPGMQQSLADHACGNSSRLAGRLKSRGQLSRGHQRCGTSAAASQTCCNRRPVKTTTAHSTLGTAGFWMRSQAEAHSSPSRIMPEPRMPAARVAAWAQGRGVVHRAMGGSESTGHRTSAARTVAGKPAVPSLHLWPHIIRQSSSQLGCGQRLCQPPRSQLHPLRLTG